MRRGLFVMMGALICAAPAEARQVEWSGAVASVYDGIGLGGVSACKGYMPPSLWRRGVVAHKSLPCGTRVRLLYRGRKTTATVWDRGPYVAGREFDLDLSVQRRLRFPYGVDGLRWRIVR